MYRCFKKRNFIDHTHAYELVNVINKKDIRQNNSLFLKELIHINTNVQHTN